MDGMTEHQTSNTAELAMTSLSVLACFTASLFGAGKTIVS